MLTNAAFFRLAARLHFPPRQNLRPQPIRETLPTQKALSTALKTLRTTTSNRRPQASPRVSNETRSTLFFSYQPQSSPNSLKQPPYLALAKTISSSNTPAPVDVTGAANVGTRSPSFVSLEGSSRKLVAGIRIR